MAEIPSRWALEHAVNDIKFRLGQWILTSDDGQVAAELVKRLREVKAVAESALGISAPASTGTQVAWPGTTAHSGSSAPVATPAEELREEVHRPLVIRVKACKALSSSDRDAIVQALRNQRPYDEWRNPLASPRVSAATTAPELDIHALKAHVAKLDPLFDAITAVKNAVAGIDLYGAALAVDRVKVALFNDDKSSVSAAERPPHICVVCGHTEHPGGERPNG